MIYTLTFNPAIDYVVHSGGIRLGGINRTESENIYYGGKGINVSLILKELGVSSVALGFIAGFTGEAIDAGLTALGIRTDFIRLEEGNSRINVKIKAEEETEINGRGPFVGQKALDKLFMKLDKLTSSDILVISGSLPKGVPADVYETIAGKMSEKGVRLAADVGGELLRGILKYRPFLVKPNRQEAEEFAGIKADSEESITECARRLKKAGAENVLVSLSGDGALLLDEAERLHRIKAHRGEVVSSVGAGDSMLAGFLAGYMAKGCPEAEKSYEPDIEYALRLAGAAGSATAFSDGLAGKEKIEKLLGQRL